MSARLKILKEMVAVLCTSELGISKKEIGEMICLSMDMFGSLHKALGSLWANGKMAVSMETASFFTWMEGYFRGSGIKVCALVWGLSFIRRETL
jgi:hypothetical protein